MFKEDDMKKTGRDEGMETTGFSEGARRATGENPVEAKVGPLGPGQRWSVARKREVTLRMLRGESLESLSRELGVEAYRLAEWRLKAMMGIDASLLERTGTAEQAQLDAALKRIGELSMENELLRTKCRQTGPFAPRRSR